MDPRHTRYPRNERTDNFLRAAEFRNPRWIPAVVSIMPATWRKYREAVERIVLDHPRLFPGYRQGDRDFDEVGRQTYRQGRYTDDWRCVWENIREGLNGVVVESPLANWSALDTYRPPDPLAQVDWEAADEEVRRAMQEGRLATGSLEHGFMYMRLYYLRGFENLMVDIASREGRLQRLISMVLDHNLLLIERWIEAGVEMMTFGDDLGTQKGLPMSPRHFREHLQPCYARMFETCREEGVLVYLHTDGHILEVIEDLIACGVTILNPQVRPNTLEGLARTAKRRVCIHLDLDRQLFPFAAPVQLREHIGEAIELLREERGGLMLHAECEPDVPLRNIEAICNALEEWCGPWME